jgi:hypothetical protein
MKLTLLAGRYAVCRLAPASEVPSWAFGGTFYSITRTSGELSIVCEEGRVPPGVRNEAGWAALELEGPIPFETAGVLASLSAAIAGAGISLFALSTFDTDYVLVKVDKVVAAASALRSAGYSIAGDI